MRVFLLPFKKLYEEMKIRVEKAIESGSISEDIKNQHNGFLEWNSNVTKQDHHSIVKVITTLIILCKCLKI